MAHYNLIKKLIQEIKSLREENNSLNESIEYSQSAQSRMEDLLAENDRIERERQYERDEQSYRDSQRQDLMKKLERAEEWGDSWGVDRIKRDLKKI